MYPNLKAEKARMGLTYNDLAKVIGVPGPSFQRKMKTGAFKPSEVIALCNLFGKDVKYLFEKGEEE